MDAFGLWLRRFACTVLVICACISGISGHPAEATASATTAAELRALKDALAKATPGHVVVVQEQRGGLEDGVVLYALAYPPHVPDDHRLKHKPGEPIWFIAEYRCAEDRGHDDANLDALLRNHAEALLALAELAVEMATTIDRAGVKASAGDVAYAADWLARFRAASGAKEESDG